MTNNLEQLGATALAILAFSERWGADTLTAITDEARRLNLNPEDKALARIVCERFNLNPQDLGDTAPRVEPITPVPNLALVRTAAQAWQDARDGDSNDDQHQAAEALIDELMKHAGLEMVRRE